MHQLVTVYHLKVNYAYHDDRNFLAHEALATSIGTLNILLSHIRSTYNQSFL